MIELEIQRLREDARVPDRAYDGDAGLDLAACDEVRLEPGERALVGTGLAVAIPEGYAGFVQPRSGLAARHGIAVVNSPGLIDSGYRGEIKVVLLNTDRETTFVAEPGERIAQLVVLPVPELAVREVDELQGSERGVRGFGSSQTVLWSRESERQPSSGARAGSSSSGRRSRARSTGCSPAAASTLGRRYCRP